LVPDLLATLVALGLLRGVHLGLGEWVVDECARKFGVREIFSDTRQGLIEIISSRLSLDELSRRFHEGSLVALAGAVALAANSQHRRAGFAISVLWIVFAFLTAWRAKPDEQRKGAVARDRRRLWMAFLVVLGGSVLMKVGPAAWALR
jgi:hypothetical protein